MDKKFDILGDFDTNKCKIDGLQCTDDIYLFFGWTNFHERAVYIGQIESSDDKIRQGIGLSIYSSGMIGLGSWVNNLVHGHVRLITRIGKCYEGNFLNNIEHGFGKCVSREG